MSSLGDAPAAGSGARGAPFIPPCVRWHDARVNLTGRIGEHYEIVTPLGAGAMGEVYRGVDRKMFDRPVAIKFLASALTGSQEGRARFRREVETSARLHHPNIVTI